MNKPHFKFCHHRERWYCYIVHPTWGVRVAFCSGFTLQECYNEYNRLANGMTA